MNKLRSKWNQLDEGQRLASIVPVSILALTGCFATLTALDNKQEQPTFNPDLPATILDINPYRNVTDPATFSSRTIRRSLVLEQCDNTDCHEFTIFIPEDKTGPVEAGEEIIVSQLDTTQ